VSALLAAVDTAGCLAAAAGRLSVAEAQLRRARETAVLSLGPSAPRASLGTLHLGAALQAVPGRA
jgi:hypothetical protein